MTANLDFATSGSQPQLINATYRRLQRLGFEDAEAAYQRALRLATNVAERRFLEKRIAEVSASSGGRARPL